MTMEILDGRRDISGGYKVDASRGQRVSRVSSEWFSRPADERFLSLSELFASVRGRAERSRTQTVESAAIRVEASRDNTDRLALVLPGSETSVAPTHWSFGQLAPLVGAPAAYLRQLPAPLAGINLQYGLTAHRAERVKTLEVDDGRVELRAITGPDYGRIYDRELVEAVQRIAGDGTSDTRWKVPGVLDWSTNVYNPQVDVTGDTTTLYASDRDVFSVSRRRPQPDRSWATARWLSSRPPISQPPRAGTVKAGRVLASRARSRPCGTTCPCSGVRSTSIGQQIMSKNLFGSMRYGCGPTSRFRRLGTPTSGPQQSLGSPLSHSQKSVYCLAILVV